MKVIVETPQVKAREELIDFVQEKVGKLEGFSDRLLEARVVLRVDQTSDRVNKVCQIRGVIPGNDLFAEKQAQSFEEAVLLAVDALKRQLVDWKEKNKVQPDRVIFKPEDE